LRASLDVRLPEAGKGGFVRALLRRVVTMALLTMPVGTGVSAEPQSPRFRADAWFLPDEPLLGFVEIPAGSFLMGSDPSSDALAYENERFSDGPGPRRVDVPGFYVGRYEVSVAQFKAFVRATGYKAHESALAAPDDHPVAFVSWPDALAYTRWLDATLRTWPQAPADLAALLRDGWRVTLPTEMQWEKAARGTDGRRWPWGNSELADRANMRSTAARPVGSYVCPECAWGLADVSGNVWEWTRTAYTPGPYSDAPPDLQSDAVWIMRGGAYTDDFRGVRGALRGGADPGVRRAFIGFRVVLAR
jgi:formylglycine-generating enzyme required for sulfatase activity